MQQIDKHFSGCLICGGELSYDSKAHMQTCAVCGKKSLSNAICINGHYVCDACHSYGDFAAVVPLLRVSEEKDPIKLLEAAMSSPAIHMHGPEHHTLVPLVLLTAYRNCGGRLNYDADMQEAYRRASKVPGGTCGYWGVCGAAAGAGIYASVLTGSTPLNKEAWSYPQKLTADILSRLAALGGPRCCKRTCRVAIEEAAKFTRRVSGVDMPTEPVLCRYFMINRECIKENCPYYPKKES